MTSTAATAATDITAYVVTTDGQFTRTALTDPVNDYRTLIGCDTPEMVRLSSDLHLWVDGSGLDRPVNLCATQIAHNYGQDNQPYFGTAVFTGGQDRHGNTLPLSDSTFRTLAAILLLAT